MSLSSMIHTLFATDDRDRDALAALEAERLAAQERRDAAVARIRQSTSDIREMVAETVERISHRDRRNGRH